jgi:hypothetical protein
MSNNCLPEKSVTYLLGSSVTGDTTSLRGIERWPSSLQHMFRELAFFTQWMFVLTNTHYTGKWVGPTNVKDAVVKVKHLPYTAGKEDSMRLISKQTTFILGSRGSHIQGMCATTGRSTGKATNTLRRLEHWVQYVILRRLLHGVTAFVAYRADCWLSNYRSHTK